MTAQQAHGEGTHDDEEDEEKMIADGWFRTRPGSRGKWFKPIDVLNTSSQSRPQRFPGTVGSKACAGHRLELLGSVKVSQAHLKSSQLVKHTAGSIHIYNFLPIISDARETTTQTTLGVQLVLVSVNFGLSAGWFSRRGM